MYVADKYGWPVVTFKGRPIINLIRYLLHGRSIRRGKFTQQLDADPCVGQQEPTTGEPR